MKNLILITTSILLTFSECKKGPDDPFISLRTRKARVEGIWTLKSGSDISTGTSFGAEDTETTTFTETGYSSVSTITSATFSQSDQRSGIFGMKFSLKKNGTFSLEQTYDQNNSTVEGTWNFACKTKSIKNKEQIVLTLTSTSDPDNKSSSIINSNQVFVVFNIKELRNKKMVLELEDNTSNPGKDANGVDIQIVSAHKVEYVFEQ